MHFKLSKLARIIIIINVILSLSMAAFSGDRIIKMTETQNKIESVMYENDLKREDAIILLEGQGEELFIGGEFFGYYSMFMSIISLILLYIYAKYNNVIGFITALTCVFTTFVGGFLLFYVILSGKSETKAKPKEYKYKDDWSHFMHEKVDKS